MRPIMLRQPISGRGQYDDAGVIMDIMTYPGICTIMAAVLLAVIIIIIHKTTDYEYKTKERHGGV